MHSALGKQEYIVALVGSERQISQKAFRRLALRYDLGLLKQITGGTMSNQFLFKVNRKCFARLSSVFIVAFLILGMIAGFMQIQKCDATTPPTYVGHFHVSGNVILDAKNATVILKGIARMGPEYDTSFTAREDNPAYYTQDFAMMQGWGVNFIRQPFNLLAYNTSATYRADLQAEVNAEVSDGFFVLLDAHWFNDTQFPDGIFTNNNAITETADYDIVNQTVVQWCYAMVFPTLGGMAQTFNTAGYNNVIGIEINEFWPDSNRTQSWLSDKAIFQDMADYIHLTAQCPKYLIFWDMGFLGSTALFNTSPFKVGTSDSQEIVYALHIYIDPTYAPWFGGYLATSTYNDGWNWTSYYEEGDYTDGATMLDRYMTNYVLPVQQAFDVPIFADEIGVDANCATGLNDMLNYFAAQGWGFCYWAWYGQDTVGSSTTDMCLLYNDWESPQANAVVLIQHLNYKHFFAWNNPSLNIAETYNWATDTVTDTISPVTPSYASTYVFADNFSTGNFNAWTGKGQNALLTTSPAYGSFQYSAERTQSSNNLPGFNVWKSLRSSHSTLYMGFDYYVSALPPSGTNNYIAQMYDATGNNYLSIGLGNETSWDGIGFGIFGANNATVNINSYYTDNSFQPDTWHSLIFGFNSTTVTFWIDGMEVFSSAAASPIPYSNIEIFSNGANPWTSKEYIDNVKVATSPINPDIISPMTLQLYALNVTNDTQILLSNETILSNPLSYWNNESKLLAVTGLDPTITSIIVSNSPLSYTIVASSDTHSYISPSGPVQATYGSSQTFTYSAYAGFTVTGVLVDGSTMQITGSYTFTNVTAPHTISISTILTATAKPTATPTPTPTPKLTPTPTQTATSTSITSPTSPATNTKASFTLLLIIPIVVIIAGIPLLAILIRKRNRDRGNKNHKNPIHRRRQEDQHSKLSPSFSETSSLSLLLTFAFHSEAERES